MDDPITAAHAPAFLGSPLGIACLMLISSVGGSFLKDRLLSENVSTTSTVRIEALEKRIDVLQGAFADEQRSTVSAATFAVFRQEQDAQLKDLKSDVRDVLAAVNRTRR